MNTIVKFYETVDDSLLKFAVIVAKSNGKWVFCKHKERDGYSVSTKSVIHTNVRAVTEKQARISTIPLNVNCMRKQEQ